MEIFVRRARWGVSTVRLNHLHIFAVFTAKNGVNSSKLINTECKLLIQNIRDD